MMIRPALDYLKQPLVLTRGTALGVLAVLGLAAGVALVLGVTGVRGLADERSQRSAAGRDSLRRELQRERAARLKADAFNRRLAAQEAPSDRELARRIARALRLAQRHPDLLRRELRRAGVALTTVPPDVAPPVTPSSTRDTSPGPTARAPGRRRRPGRGDTSRPPSGATPDPSPRDPEPPPRPTVDVHTPGSVPLPDDLHVCTPLLGVNC